MTSRPAQGVTEPARGIDLDATARDALEALLDSGVSHLVVTAGGSGMPRGVVGARDLVGLVTHP